MASAQVYPWPEAGNSGAYITQKGCLLHEVRGWPFVPLISRPLADCRVWKGSVPLLKEMPSSCGRFSGEGCSGCEMLAVFVPSAGEGAAVTERSGQSLQCPLPLYTQPAGNTASLDASFEVKHGLLSKHKCPGGWLVCPTGH